MGIIKRLTDKSGGVGVVYSGKDPEQEVAYCHRCLEMANVRSKLGNRIYLPDDSGKTVIPPDADKWRQCHKCGTVYPKYEAKLEGKLEDFTETTENPFAFGNGKVLSLGESRKFDRTGRTQRKRKFKQDLTQYKEEDIKDALRKGAKLVSYDETMPK